MRHIITAALFTLAAGVALFWAATSHAYEDRIGEVGIAHAVCIKEGMRILIEGSKKSQAEGKTAWQSTLNQRLCIGSYEGYIIKIIGAGSTFKTWAGVVYQIWRVEVENFDGAFYIYDRVGV